MSPITISVRDLKREFACVPQIDLFKKTFGNKLEIHSLKEARDLAKKHYKDFDWEWAALYLLTRDSYSTFCMLTDKELKAFLTADLDLVVRRTRDKYLKKSALLFAKLFWEEKSKTIKD